MDVIDHIATRVSLTAALGTLAGIGTALYKGHKIPRTAAMTAFSCALAATACFGSERIIATTAGKYLISSDDKSSWEFMLATHACGGMLGGALTGAIYLGRPLQGVVFFTPLMLLVGTGEKLLRDVQEEHRERGLTQERERRGELPPK